MSSSPSASAKGAGVIAAPRSCEEHHPGRPVSGLHRAYDPDGNGSWPCDPRAWWSQRLPLAGLHLTVRCRRCCPRMGLLVHRKFSFRAAAGLLGRQRPCEPRWRQVGWRKMYPALRLYALSVTLSWPLVVLGVRSGPNGGRRFNTAVSIVTTLTPHRSQWPG